MKMTLPPMAKGDLVKLDAAHRATGHQTATKNGAST
jgi:hypothetical protein